MPPPKSAIILFDLAHSEMLNIKDNDFSEFFILLKSLNLKVKKNEEKNITIKLLQDIDVLIIGNPIGNYFSKNEIKSIVDFVREGGGLLLISEYGADYLQKTNLNDISGKHFGIYFQKNIVKEYNKTNQNCSSILSIQDFQKHNITNQLRNVIIGGTCSLLLDKNSKPILKTKQISVWSEIYNNSSRQTFKDEEQTQIIAAYTEYGRGKVFALGDIDIFTKDPNIGINCLDNRKLIINLLNWFTQPTKERDVIIWTLNQLGTLQAEVKEMNNKIKNIIETMTLLEQRISAIEEIKKIGKIKKSKRPTQFL